MESLNLKRSHGVVKVSGLVLCSVGVTVLALYQGPELKSFIHHRLFHYTSHVGTNSEGNGYWESSCNLLRLQCGLCGLYFRYTPLALLARTYARTHVLVCSAFLFALKSLHGTS